MTTQRSKYRPNSLPNIPLPSIQRHVQQLASVALASNTHKAYSRGWELFQVFLQCYNISMHNLQEQHMLEFISFLSLSNFAASTIQLYLLGVKHHLKLRGINNYEANFLLCMVVKGVSATGNKSDIRLPISLKLLHEMWGAILFIVDSKFDVIMYRSLLSFTFHGLFKPGEVTYSPHVIKAENVYFVEDQLQVHLKSSKSHRGPGSQVVTIDKQPVVCPVTDLRLYLTV